MKKTDREKYGKNLIPYGRMFGINNECGRFKIFHEYDNHANDACYGKFWQQVGKYYAKYGNALKLMLKLAN